MLGYASTLSGSSSMDFWQRLVNPGTTESDASVTSAAPLGPSEYQEGKTSVNKNRVACVGSLSSREDLNGKLGRAVKWVAHKERWAVVMLDTGEKVLVRDECLDFKDARAIAINAKWHDDIASKTPVGVPVASSTAAPLGSPAPQQSTSQTGSPDHPVQGTAIDQPAISWIHQAVQCFCLPFASGKPSAVMRETGFGMPSLSLPKQ